MDTRLEQEQAPRLRALARDYADGRFNKQEYRNRRREVIALCTGEPLQARRPEPVTEPQDDASLGSLFAGIAAMIAAVLVVFHFVG